MLPTFFPDYQEHLTEDEEIRWTNRICADGTWEANLFNFYQMVLPRLQSVLPKPFRLEENIRREETSAHVAIREAFINTLIHADYSINATLVIKHRLNEFVFTNPGTMLVSKEQYYTGGESVCRNKSLQKMFAMLGVAEKAGSGTDKIMAGWREINWKSPKVEERQQPDKVILTMPKESLLSEETKVELQKLFGKKYNSFDHNVISILALACEEEYVTNKRLRYLLNMHKADISELLKSMVRHNLLETQGYGRGMRYYLPSNANIETSNANIETSNANIETSNANIETSVRKRLSYKELSTLIMNICNDWVSIDEIEKRTSKRNSYLRNFVIKRMISEKKLEMLYPTIPNHPRQKYKVKG